MVSEFIGAILQILVFTSIPFFTYLIRKKTTKGFLDYIGLKRSTAKANVLAVFACLLFAAPMLVLTLVSNDFKNIMFDPDSLTGKFREMTFGLNSLLLLLVMAVFKTSFAEEILFRGFLAKRLISIAGFVKGNLLQAIIFGTIHAGLFAFTTSNPVFLFVIFLIPAIGAYVSVYLNEKIGNGSIIPGWISHGLANILAYGIVGFIL
jgi:uncharacterized protein